MKENFPISDNGVGVPVDTYLINDIQEVGFYHLKIESAHFLSADARNKIVSSEQPNAIIMILNEDNVEIETSVTNYLLKIGNKVGLNAQIKIDGIRATNNVVISKADMKVENPDGKEFDIPMKDDGMNGDAVANDHIFTAETICSQVGEYHFYAVLNGYILDDKGDRKPFLKTTEHTFYVAGPSVSLSGSASLSAIPNDNQRVNINIGAKLDAGLISAAQVGKLRAYTEVYGVASDGTVKPAAWLGSIVNVNADSTVTVQLNLNWLSNANVKGPLTLRNTYLADVSTSFPITKFEGDIAVKGSSSIHRENRYLSVFNVRGPITITQEMRVGVNPLKKAENTTTNPPSLVILHGYCSTDNPFQPHSHIFTGASYFLNSKSNIGNDGFAIKVDEHANRIGAVRYSLVGHSQGGSVALHLINGYFSGLDQAENGRRIQAVGTPWRGNSAAGSAANLGKLFGIGCGSCTDLTVDGARNWLAGINEVHFEHVYYYTTTYKQGNFFGDYCNMAINALLNWPNDGVTEIKYAVLGGKSSNLGNKELWCHTTGMKYPPLYNDNIRNAEINAKAAR